MLKEPDISEIAKETLAQLIDVSKVRRESLGLNFRIFLKTMFTNAVSNEDLTVEELICLLEWLKFKVLMSIAKDEDA